MQRSGNRGSHAPTRSARYCSARPSPYSVSGRQAHHGHRAALQDCHRNLRAGGHDQPTAPSDPCCEICSYTQPYPANSERVFHHHFSSMQLRMDTGVEESGEGYQCPSCKSRHRPYRDDRIKVVVGDSTVHKFFDPPGHTSSHYAGDLVHVDYVTIKGAYIHQLIHAFRVEYEKLKQAKPLDVVLVGGYADLLSGHSREFILEGYRYFADRVLALGAKLAPHSRSTVAIASLMYPPKLAWFRDNGPEPYNYRNQKDKINWLNSKIDDLNHENSVPVYPGFHTYGIRVETITTTDGNGEEVKTRRKAHRWGHWVEGPRREKIMLKPDRGFVMGKALNNYFLYRTGAETS